ncbi:choice-of-anchor G family protein [Microbacterium sp. JZ101]
MDNSTAGARAPRKRRLAPIATLAAASLVAGGVAYAANVNTTGAANAAAPGAVGTDPSAAQGQILQLDTSLLGDLTVADLGHTLTSNPSGTELEDDGALNLGALNDGLTVDIGSLIGLNLIGDSTGLLRLGDLGALQSYSTSPSLTNSRAVVGFAGEDGVVDLGNAGPSGESAVLDLTGLFSQLQIDGLTDQILDQARIQIGALGAEAEYDAGTLTSQYKVADLQVDLHSALLGSLTEELTDVVGSALEPVDGLVGEGGVLNTAVGQLSSVVDGVDLTLLGTGVRLDSDPTLSGVQITGIPELINGVVTDLTGEISNTSGSVSINLADGSIHLDLGELVVEGYGADNLNSLPANSEVFSEAVVNAITNGLTEAVVGSGENSLVTKLNTLLSERIWNLGVAINVNASGELCVLVGCSTLAAADITVQGTLAEFAGYNGETLDSSNISTTLNLLGIIDAGTLINGISGQLLAPLVNNVAGPLLTTITDDVLGALQETVQAELVEPVVGTVFNLVGPVLDALVSLRINEQPTEAPIGGTGDLPGDSFTVRALSLTLLPALDDAVKLDLASATVKALAAAPVIAGTDPAYSGHDLPLTGADWPASSTVSVTLEDSEGNVVAGPVDVETDADGAIVAGELLPLGDIAAGDYTIVGISDGIVARDAQTVYAPTVAATEPATAGTDVPVTGEGFPPSTLIELVVVDPDGNPVEDADGNVIVIEFTSTPEGGVPAGTVYPLPEDAVDGTYTLEASDPAVGGPVATDDFLVGDGSDVDAAANADAEADVNASASASASADATADGDPSAQAAAQAAALADATTDASAAADVTAAAAAQAAATADASSDASATAESDVNAAAQAAAQSSAEADSQADASAAAEANSAAAAEAASNADSSTNASVEASANANASSSAAASANADADSNAVAEAAAQAAAYADATAETSAAADATANAAAQAAATADSSTNASADISADANASSAAAAQAAALADATTDANAEASAAVEGNASAAAAAASDTDSSNEASANAAADVNAAANADADADVNASASASASANADDNSNASAQVAAQAAALADATTDASAAADATAAAAAQAAATADASSDASTTADSDVTAAAQAAAQSSAEADSQADSTAAANANASAAAAAASNADSSTNATAEASADATAEASADATAEASADATAEASADATAEASASADANAAAEASAAADSSSASDSDSAADSDSASDSDSSATASANANASSDSDGSAISMELEHDRRMVGQVQIAYGHGFEPGETVEATMYSTPHELGTQVADENGDVTFTWTIKSGTPTGDHRVELVGATSGSVDATFEVYAKSGQLSPTGGDLALPLGGLAAAMLLGSAAIWMMVRRRGADV